MGGNPFKNRFRIRFFLIFCFRIGNKCKLNYLLGQPITELQSRLIIQLKENILQLPGKSFYLNSTIKNTGIQLANQFCENDFKNTFSSLDLNSVSKATFSPICQNCIDDLTNTTIEDPENIESGLPNCNCRWNCSHPLSGCNTCEAGHYKNCCTPTKVGCGFLLLQRCTGRDEPCALSLRPKEKCDDLIEDSGQNGN